MRILPVDHPAPIVAVQGVMLYPRDTARDRENAAAFADFHLREELQRLQRGGVDIPVHLEPYLESPARLPKDANKRGIRGTVAGELFKVAFELVLNEPEKASWQNAYRIVSELRKNKNVPASVRWLREIRDQFQSVCHLWAALNLRDRLPTGNEDFHAFLDEAETLLFHGRMWRHSRDKAEPLLPEDVWHVPEDWQPPADVHGIPFYSIDPGYKDHIRSAGRPRENEQIV